MTGPGVVAFLFTDLVGSTALIDRLGDDAADKVRRDHFDLLRRAVKDAGGEEVKTLGDGLMVSFTSPVAALGCAVAMQRALAEGELKIRVGVHAGEPVQEGDDYFGTPVVLAKRLCDRAEGGQILATEVLAGLVGTRGGFSFLPRGRLALKGLSEPVSAVEVRWQFEAAESAGTRATSRPRSRPARPRGPGIVGRDRHLAVLDDELAGAVDGEVRCVLVLGEPGVGKTRLVREFLARHDDVTPLTARAHPMGETTAFGLWGEALDGHLRHLPAAEVPGLCGGFVDDLAAILRSVAAVRGSLPSSAPPRSALLQGITVVLENLAAEAPVVVVLDDIHQADGSSLDALSYLATNLYDTPVLLVLSARPAELAEHRLANRVLLPLEQDGLLIRLPVEPLDDEDVRALAASVLKVPPPAALVPWLQARARGNPLFALGLVRALLEEGADLNAPELRRIPEDLADRVRALLVTLDSGALTVLEVLAVLGRPATIDELGSLTAKSDDDLSARLDELTRIRAVTEEARRGEPAFAVSHPLVQETIYASIGTPRRRLIHREIARALLGAGRPAEAAPHFTRSAGRGDAEAIEALRLALRQAEEQRAFREALATLAGLVEILPEGDQRWLEIGRLLSGEAEWAQYPNPSRPDVELAIRALRAMDAVLARSGEIQRRGILELRLSHLLTWGLGDPMAGGQAADEAIRLFEAAGDESMSLQARHQAAWAKGLGGDMAALVADSAAIIEAASALGEEFVGILATAAEASGHFYLGDMADGERMIRRAIALASTRLQRPPTQWRGVLAFGLAMQGRSTEARQELDAARAADPTVADSNLLELGCIALAIAGDVRQTLSWAEEAIAWTPGPLTALQAIGLPFAALMAAEAGDQGLARRYADKALAACAGEYAHVSASARAVLARLDFWDGVGPAAVTRLLSSVEHLLSYSVKPMAASFAVDLAECAASIGDEEAGGRAVDVATEVAAITGSDLYRGMQALASAWLRLAASAPECAGFARQAISVLDDIQFPLLQGRAYDLLGRALAADGDPSRAAEGFRQAMARFESCGAAWRLDRAAAELEGLA